MKLFFFYLLLMTTNIAQAFELVIVQSVSSSKRSFVTRTGKEVGVFVGQKAAFTTPSVSLLAEATAVNREFTVWQVSDPAARIPFEKNQIVEFNNSLESIYTNVKLREDKIIKRISRRRALIFRGSYAQTLNESVSDVSADAGETTRISAQYEFGYQTQFAKYLYGTIGLRYDGELTTGSNYEVTTTRLIGTLELELLLPRFKNLNTQFYTSVGGGYGTSNSEILGVDISGSVSVLPFIRSGFRTPLGSSRFALLIEGGVEAMHSTEQFEDSSVQTTDTTNYKGTLGLIYSL